MTKRKKEKYIHRWLREHPQVRLYLKRTEYEWLKELADKKGVSMKEIILEAIRNAKKFYDEGYKRGFENGALDEDEYFIDNPRGFYETVMKRAEEMGLSDFEPCLFTAPCYICGEPMVFTHGDEDWASEVRPILLRAFKNWYHTKCKT